MLMAVGIDEIITIITETNLCFSILIVLLTCILIGALISTAPYMFYTTESVKVVAKQDRTRQHDIDSKIKVLGWSWSSQ